MSDAAMTAKEARLAAFFESEEPPARDPVFSSRVMDRLARRRVMSQALDLVGPVMTALALAIALWPAILSLGAFAAERMGVALPILFAVAVSVGTLWAAREMRRFMPVEIGL